MILTAAAVEAQGVYIFHYAHDYDLPANVVEVEAERPIMPNSVLSYPPPPPLRSGRGLPKLPGRFTLLSIYVSGGGRTRACY